MKSPGKVLLLLGAALPLFASLNVTTDATKVIAGDSVTLRIEASGDNVEPPVLSKLCGEKVLATSQSTSIQSVNGKFSKSYAFDYRFEPLKDCRIESIEVTIDGKVERSEPIDIRVVPMQITKNSPFILEFESEKRSVYVGEPFKAVLVFKQHRNSEAVRSEFSAPELKHFWIKEEQQSRRFQEGDYTVTRVTYILAAQQSGMLEVAPAKIKIATRSGERDAWGQWFPTLKWRTYVSNTLNIEVKPLPSGVKLVGDFAIEVTADKNEIDANEAVNVTLKVTGRGNFEDIGSLKPDVSGVGIYEEEPKVRGYVEESGYRGSWTQKFAFVGERSFTVPVFELTYFDPESNTTKKVATEPIPVTVRGAPEAQEEAPLKIERAAETPDTAKESKTEVVAQMTNVWLFVWGAAAGLAAGIVLVRIPFGALLHRRKGAKGAEHLSAGDHKAVLGLLMRNLHDPEAAEMAKKLEENLYGGAGHVIDKKAIKALVKRLEG